MLKVVSDVTEKPRLLPDGRERPVVRIINGVLDERNGEIVLIGPIDPNTYRFLKVDHSYQRPLENRPKLDAALRAGVIVPNIEINVRDGAFETAGNDYLIYTPAYIIDGQQRHGSAVRVLEQSPDHPPRLFGTVRFNHDAAWEAERFTDLNVNSRKIAASLLLRNRRGVKNVALTQLYGLSHNTREFPLYKKVCWEQNMHRGDLITAYLFVRTATKLHAHLRASSSHGAAEALAEAALKQAQEISPAKFRKNVETFFEMIDEAWGVREIEYRFSAVQLKSGFLLQLARLLSTHLDFWNEADDVLHVPADVKRRLSKFGIADPTVKNLSGASTGGSSNLLYQMMINHLNKGKQKENHLRSRYS